MNGSLAARSSNSVGHSLGVSSVVADDRGEPHVVFRRAYDELISLVAVLPWCAAQGHRLWRENLDKPSVVLRCDKAGFLRTLRARCLDFEAWLALHEEYGFEPCGGERLRVAAHMRGFLSASSPTDDTIRMMVRAGLGALADGHDGFWREHLHALRELDRILVRSWQWILVKNRSLVQARVRHFMARYGNLPSDAAEDLEQVGLLALRHAIALFDPSRGHRFSTYAVPWIDHGIRRAIPQLTQEACSLDEVVVGDDEDGLTLGEMVSDEVGDDEGFASSLTDELTWAQRRRWLEGVVAGWPEVDRSLLMAVMGGRVEEWAAARGLTARSARRRCAELLKMLQALWQKHERACSARRAR